MYREMKAEEALKEYIAGRNVVLMEVMDLPDGVTQYRCTSLKALFAGAVFLAAVPDIPDGGGAGHKEAEGKARRKPGRKRREPEGDGCGEAAGKEPEGDGCGEPAGKEPEGKGPPPAAGKRGRLLIAEDMERIRKRYRSGAEMEAISEELGISLAAVSRFIAMEGLGDERYRGTRIPSKGSAPITTALPLRLKA